MRFERGYREWTRGTSCVGGEPDANRNRRAKERAGASKQGASDGRDAPRGASATARQTRPSSIESADACHRPSTRASRRFGLRRNEPVPE